MSEFGMEGREEKKEEKRRKRREGKGREDRYLTCGQNRVALFVFSSPQGLENHKKKRERWTDVCSWP